MSAFVPRDFDIPVNRELITSQNPLDNLKYQEQLALNIKNIASEISNGIYGETRKFSPVARGSTVAGTGTYETQVGLYTRFGNMVWFSIAIAFTDANHTGTGNLEITGLPVKAYNLTNLQQIIPVHSALGGSQFQGIALIEPNENHISAIYNGGNTLQINGNDTDLIITGSYRAIS